MEKVSLPLEGKISSDGVVIVGAQQTLFLRGGSNQLFRLYQQPDFLDDATLASAWADLSLARQKRSDECGISFLQIVIPEKTSVYAPMSPISNVGETRLLKRTRIGIIRAVRPQSFLDCYALLTHTLAPLATYRRLDSHLSTFGAHTIVAASLARLGHLDTLQETRRSTIWRKMPADLGNSFPEIEDEDELLVERLHNAAGQDLEPDLLHKYDPGEKHIGKVRHWRCANAPLNKKVLVFGNSFFGTGEHSGQLSWWFCRLFQDCTFMWAPQIDWDLVREYQPDYLLAQTIERFLTRAPES